MDAAVAMPTLQRAATAVAQHAPRGRPALGLDGALRPVMCTWDSAGSSAIYERQAQIVREAGALAELPIYVSSWALDKAWNGDLAGAALLIAESDTVAAATGSQLPPFAALRLAALRGREAEATPLIEATIEHGTARGQGLAVRVAQWAAAVLYNGLSRYDEAFSAARQVTGDDIDPYPLMWVLIELVEAAIRVGRDRRRARGARATGGGDGSCRDRLGARHRGAFARLAARRRGGGRPLPRGDRAVRPHAAPSRARSRASALRGVAAPRRPSRRCSCEQLRTAYEMFFAIGMEAFAERARRELNATGEKVRKRSPETRDELTPQEEQIARLARDGLSNPEIGAQLFISARTVEWHLRKVFTKLGINSRRQLRTALPNGNPLVGTT